MSRPSLASCRCCWLPSAALLTVAAPPRVCMRSAAAAAATQADDEEGAALRQQVRPGRTAGLGVLRSSRACPLASQSWLTARQLCTVLCSYPDLVLLRVPPCRQRRSASCR